jgi:SnoaL-like domain
MRNSKLLYFGAGALITMIFSGAAYTLGYTLDAKTIPKSGPNTLLSAEDYIEIQQLYGMYARDVDPGSVRDASWMFTKDAVLVIGDLKPMKTSDEIKAFYVGVKDRQATGGVRHFNSSYVIVGTPGGGARGSSYMMQVETKAEGGHPEITLFGKYEDKLVKTPEGWRIKERVWKADSFRGSRLPVTASPVPGDRRTDTTGAGTADD